MKKFNHRGRRAHRDNKRQSPKAKTPTETLWKGTLRSLPPLRSPSYANPPSTEIKRDFDSLKGEENHQPAEFREDAERMKFA
jgi:hypothetical protein